MPRARRERRIRLHQRTFARRQRGAARPPGGNHDHAPCAPRRASATAVSRRSRRQLPASEEAARRARQHSSRARIAAAALRAVEDEAIRDIVRFQEDLGLRGITDGEFRRTYFHTDFLTRLSGVTTKGGINVSFHSASGNVDFAPPVMSVTDKVRHAQPIQRADFEFLRSVTTRTPKVTIPSPTMLHFRGGRGAISQRRLSGPRGVLRRTSRRPIATRSPTSRPPAARTCSSTTPTSPTCATPKMREGARQRGDDPDELPRRYARLINAAIAKRPANMTACVHLCRGNFKSAWAAEGGYEPVARGALQRARRRRLLPRVRRRALRRFRAAAPRAEGQDGRAGPRQHEGRPAREQGRPQAPHRHAAAKLVPLEQLCLSPQCGFSSTVHGNDIAVESQTAKLRLVVETAREVWGGI